MFTLHVFETYFVGRATQLALPSDKKQAIRKAVDAMAGAMKISADDLFDAVMEREKVMSTGMGHGVAIPHAKIKGLKDFAVSISRSDSPIDYGSLDATPVRILALLLSPEDRTKEHVKMIADITKRLKYSHVRQSILDAYTAAEIEAAFLQAG